MATVTPIGEAARAAYYDTLGRVNDGLRAHLDTFGETIRRARRVEAIDRGPTDREVALQLRLTASTYLEVADALAPETRQERVPGETTTAVRRRRDAQTGKKTT